MFWASGNLEPRILRLLTYAVHLWLELKEKMKLAITLAVARNVQ
jgi:hypothetical protein